MWLPSLVCGHRTLTFSVVQSQKAVSAFWLFVVIRYFSHHTKQCNGFILLQTLRTNSGYESIHHSRWYLKWHASRRFSTCSTRHWYHFHLLAVVGKVQVQAKVISNVQGPKYNSSNIPYQLYHVCIINKACRFISRRHIVTVLRQ